MVILLRSIDGSLLAGGSVLRRQHWSQHYLLGTVLGPLDNGWH